MRWIVLVLLFYVIMEVIGSSMNRLVIIIVALILCGCTYDYTHMVSWGSDRSGNPIYTLEQVSWASTVTHYVTDCGMHYQYLGRMCDSTYSQCRDEYGFAYSCENDYSNLVLYGNGWDVEFATIPIGTREAGRSVAYTLIFANDGGTGITITGDTGQLHGLSIGSKCRIDKERMVFTSCER